MSAGRWECAQFTHKRYAHCQRKGSPLCSSNDRIYASQARFGCQYRPEGQTRMERSSMYITYPSTKISSRIFQQSSVSVQSFWHYGKLIDCCFNQNIYGSCSKLTNQDQGFRISRILVCWPLKIWSQETTSWATERSITGSSKWCCEYLCLFLRELRCIGFPLYFYRPKHCNAKGCTKYFEVPGGDSQDFYRRTIRNCVCCCPGTLLFLSPSLISIRFFNRLDKPFPPLNGVWRISILTIVCSLINYWVSSRIRRTHGSKCCWIGGISV